MTVVDPPSHEMVSSEVQSGLPLYQAIFDEMNLVELPFALLSLKSTNSRVFSLSPDGRERLVADEAVGGLPSALAERVVLALMWLTNHQSGFGSPTLRFALRTLVTDYVYPGRFNASYRPSADLLSAVEEQIRRVAHTRLISDRWYDRVLGRHVSIDASIIDYFLVVDKGGRSGPRTLELRWGQKFFESVRAHYTKPIDLTIYQRIEVPLDRRLFRWLDRQLAKKPIQKVQSCQAFARSKLAMTGTVVERGGRTASSYIVGSLKESIERLSEIGFRVKLTVDAENADYTLTFERLADTESSSVQIEDPAQTLIPIFDELAHGIPRTALRRPVDARDREVASRWMRSYGEAQSTWLIRRCLELQQQTGGRRILKFAGLELYEPAAVGDHQRRATERNGQLSLTFSDSKPELWKRYRDALATRPLPEKVQGVLLQQAEERAAALRLPGVSEQTRKKVMEGELRNLKLEHQQALGEREFLAFDSEAALREMLMERHGFDPLEPGAALPRSA